MHHGRGCLRWRGQVVVCGRYQGLPGALAAAHLRSRRRHEHLRLIPNAVLTMHAVDSLLLMVDLRSVLAGAAAPLARGRRLTSTAACGAPYLHIIHSDASIHLAS